MSWNLLSSCIGSMFCFFSPFRTLERTSSAVSRWTRGFFSGARIFHVTAGACEEKRRKDVEFSVFTCIFTSGWKEQSLVTSYDTYYSRATVFGWSHVWCFHGKYHCIHQILCSLNQGRCTVQLKMQSLFFNTILTPCCSWIGLVNTHWLGWL